MPWIWNQHRNEETTGEHTSASNDGSEIDVKFLLAMLSVECILGRVVGRDKGGIIAWPIADWSRLLPVGALTGHDVESGS